MSLGQRENSTVLDLKNTRLSQFPDKWEYRRMGPSELWFGAEKIYQNFENLPELQVEGKTHRENRAKFFEYVFLWGGGQIRAKYSHLGRKFEQIM